MIDRELIINTARGYVGTPFHHLGRKLGVGVDCYGLIFCTLRDLGVEIPDYRYPHRQTSDGFFHECAAYFSEGSMELGDIAILWIRRPNRLCHLAFLGPGTLIHACDRTGRVVEMTLDDRWRKRIGLIRRPPGIHIPVSE